MSDTDRHAGLGARRGRGEAHLVLARPSDPGAAAYCRNRLVAGDHPESMAITVLTDLDERGGSRERDGSRGIVVAMGGEVRGSAATDRGATDPDAQPGPVPARGDLGSVGRTVDDLVTTTAERGQRPVVCVDSLNGLLERASIRGAYRFLYVLRRRIDEVDGEVHVHVDPTSHDEEIIRTFFAVFDRVVAFEDDRQPLL